MNIVKTKRQILYIFLGLLTLLSFYLILKNINRPIVIQPPEEKETPLEEKGFVYFQTSIGKIIEGIALNKEAYKKFENIMERAKKARDESEKLKNLSQDLKKLTDECLCGKSSCQGINCEKGCCCQATGCPEENTCSKPCGCSTNDYGCDLASACPERHCDTKAISDKIMEIKKAMAGLKSQEKEISTAQLSLLSDYVKLKKAISMISLPSGTIDYENFFKKRNRIEETYKQKVAVTTFSTWPEPSIKMGETTVLDPASIYFDIKEDENSQIIQKSSCFEPFLALTNKCPEDLSQIMVENAQEVFSDLNFGDLTPSAEEMHSSAEKAIKEATPQIASEISEALTNVLKEEITAAIIEELKGKTGKETDISTKLANQIEPILEDKLPDELSNLFSTEIEKETLTILSNTDLVPYETTNLLSRNLADSLPNNARDILSSSTGEILPGDLMNLLSTDLTKKLFDGQLSNIVPGEIHNIIKKILLKSLPDKATEALSLSFKNILVVGLEKFLSENIPQTFGFVSSDTKKLADKTEEKIREELPAILDKELKGKLSLKQINQFSLALLEKESFQKKPEEILFENLPLVLEKTSKKASGIIAWELSPKLARNMGKKLSNMSSEELSQKVAEDLKEIIIPSISRILKQGLLLNSLNNEENKKEIKISYPQFCQSTIPNLEKTDKENKLFEVCWKVKTIYDAASYQINSLQETINLIRDPEEGCNPERCQAQCLDASCQAKDFHCQGGLPTECNCEEYPECKCQPDCVGHCSKYQTSYLTGSLPCKSNYIDFYNNNGQFRACPDLYLGNEMVARYYLQIEKAEEEIEDILKGKYTRDIIQFKEKMETIKRNSETLKDLNGELKELTDHCQCSKKSLCEELPCGCLAKGCSPFSQCSQADIQKITEKTKEIEEAIEELYYSCKDK